MKIKVGGGEYDYSRPHLKVWLELEELRSKLNESIHKHDKHETARYICLTVSKALGIEFDQTIKASWLDIRIAYTAIIAANVPTNEFPFLNAKVKDSREAWDYSGRAWYMWAHMFAEEYGWDLDTIADLDVDDAIALAQEIAVEEQLNREWEWARTEIAYQAKGGFKPLNRPDWMRYTKVEPIKMYRVRKEFLPSGIIIRDSSSGNGRGS